MMDKPLVIRRLETAGCITIIETRQWLPAVMFLIVFIWYLASPSRVVAMGMVTLAGMLVIGYLWSYHLAARVEGERVLRYAAVQVGDELEESVFLKNNSVLPVLWAEFVDRSNIPGYMASSVRAASSSSQVKWRVGSICSRRGVFLLGPWELCLGDPFGLFRVRKVYTQRQEILVYPSLAELPEHLLPHSGVQGEMRPLHQPLQADTIDAVTVRPYVPGDPIRDVHWPTTARKNQPFIKTFQPEAATSIWLVPDCDFLAHLGEGPESTFETMVLITASLAARLLKDRMSVGLLVNGANEVVVQPQSGQQHLWNILKALAPIEPVVGHPLAETFDHLRQIISGHSMLIAITPSLNPGWLPHVSSLAGIRSRGRTEIILLDPCSFGGGGSADSMLPVLTDQGITGRVIARGQVKPITASYGELSRWEFTSGATGRAILRKTPRSSGIPGSQGSAPRHKQWINPS